MQLNQQTDFAFRILIYLADHAAANRVSGDHLGRPKIREIAAFYGVSYNHLMKVANALATHGYVRSRRGKSGGLALARAPEAISLGDVARDIEAHWEVVECFGATTDCPLAHGCRLAPILAEALNAFWAVLDKYTLADIAFRPTAESPIDFHPRPESPASGRENRSPKPA
ncbi:Rrf2 family transcriptional regulator [Guyparkeria hydrothermalis]|uniref:RrF2 family transcriptional regulator n=1 Tax=Guyparkeria hydrothermalis TaxID=923 RepID=UPI002022521A|nr:Rrf2 family transcriptional regulator [Guyparkeria hydrothermalis]